MKAGDIALKALPQADGVIKLRPVLLLARMPPFNDWLVCGVSTQLHQATVDFDQLILPTEPDFAGSGLKAASLIRLGFLATIPEAQLEGRIGSIAASRLTQLRQALAQRLASTESDS